MKLRLVLEIKNVAMFIKTCEEKEKTKNISDKKKMISPTLILCIDEPKLDKTFPDSQFQIENYQYPLFPRDRN